MAMHLGQGSFAAAVQYCKDFIPLFFQKLVTQASNMEPAIYYTSIKYVLLESYLTFKCESYPSLLDY